MLSKTVYLQVIAGYSFTHEGYVTSFCPYGMLDQEFRRNNSDVLFCMMFFELYSGSDLTYTRPTVLTKSSKRVINVVFKWNNQISVLHRHHVIMCFRSTLMYCNALQLLDIKSPATFFFVYHVFTWDTTSNCLTNIRQKKPCISELVIISCSIDYVYQL